MRYFSCDSHVVEAREVFEGLEDRFGTRAPRIEHDWQDKPGDWLILPNTFRRLFAEGAFSVAFVPMYSRALHGDGGEEAADRFAGDVLSVPISEK